MTEAKVIGTVIEETNYSNNGTFAMKRKISTNGVEYTIVPLSSGEVLAKNGVLTEEDIAEVIAKWTGIPTARLTQDENKKLKN